MVHIAVRLDPTRDRPKRILKDIVYPTLRLERVAPSQVDIAVAIATSLRLHAADAASVAVALVERMKTEKDSRALGSLGGALGALSQSGKLEGKDVQPGLEVPDRAIKSSTDQGSMQGLIRA